MIDRLRRPRPDRQLGQVLPLTAIFMFALLGIASLVLDVARVYALQQFERSVADAAALAGAQDLQTPNSKGLPSAGQQAQARTAALNLLYRELGHNYSGTTSCGTDSSGNYVDCAVPGTDYLVSIKTPSPSVMTVDPNLAIQVTVRQPAVSLTLARLFGQTNWNVAITSVAGLDFGAGYAVEILRPPKPLPNGTSDQNEADIVIDGGSTVDIVGDVGTNTNLDISGSGSAVNLGTSDKVYYFDTYQAWTSPPPGKEIVSPIPDPNYLVPLETGTGVVKGAQDTVGCAAEIAKAVTAGYKLASLNTTCWLPGYYTTDIGKSLQNTSAVLLEPGVYFFDHGLSMGATLIGGYQAGGPGTPHTGVALVFPEANNTQSGQFAGNNANLVSLNAGSCIASSNPIACKTFASPALAADGITSVQVVFKSSFGDVITPETLIVAPKDSKCIVGTTESNGCNDNGNNSIKLPGGGSLFVAGVQYGPSDNMFVGGGSGGIGYLGQIVAWTVHYTGGSAVKEVYAGGLGNGVLRLDAACSGPNTVCNP
jgi:Putative Flp pilus-assembly TadE/G-like